MNIKHSNVRELSYSYKKETKEEFEVGVFYDIAVPFFKCTVDVCNIDSELLEAICSSIRYRTTLELTLEMPPEKVPIFADWIWYKPKEENYTYYEYLGFLKWQHNKQYLHCDNAMPRWIDYLSGPQIEFEFQGDFNVREANSQEFSTT